MKKNLLATSALVAAGVLATSGAFAESSPIQIKVGGYMEQWVGVASFENSGETLAGNATTRSSEANDFDTQMDAEIHFSGSTTLDNGLTFGVNVQLEAQTDPNARDVIDEAYAFVRGSFGEILIGEENGAAYSMHYGFGSFGVGVTMNSGDLSAWFPAPNSYQLSGTYQGFRHVDNDSQKVRYISPRFAGFQIGADYSPEGRQDSDSFPTELKNAGVVENVWSVAANYQGEFSGIGLGVSGGYQGVGDNNRGPGTSNDMYNYGFGVYATFSGFRLSGSWTYENEPTAAIDSRDVFGAGISYGDGPWVIGLDGAWGTQSYVAALPDTDMLSLQLGGTYKLGPGVEARGSIYYADMTDGAGRAGNDWDGFAVVGGIRLVF